MDNAVWTCEIGPIPRDKLPPGADFPLRQAVKNTFRSMFDDDAEYCASGWGREAKESKKNKVERTITALREAANAMDELGTQRMTLFGPTLNVHALRSEADWLEKQMKMWTDLTTEEE